MRNHLPIYLLLKEISKEIDHSNVHANKQTLSKKAF